MLRSEPLEPRLENGKRLHYNFPFIKPFERGEIFSQRAFSIFTDIRKLQEKAETSYTLITEEGNPIRLYSLDEITEIFGKLGLRICNSFADFIGKPSSDNDIQLMVYSIRE